MKAMPRTPSSIFGKSFAMVPAVPLFCEVGRLRSLPLTLEPLAHFLRQLRRCLLHPRRKLDANHSSPVNFTALPALRSRRISASAFSSAAVASASVTP